MLGIFDSGLGGLTVVRRKRTLLAVGALAVVLFAIFGLRFGLGERASGDPTTLTVWGPLEESEKGWESIRQRYERLYPNVTILYRRVPYDDYEQVLLDAFAVGTPPDILYLHHTWLPKFLDKLEPMPEGKDWMSFREYRDTFVDVVTQDFTRDEAVLYAVPLYLETLALYYNEDIFEAAGIAEPPKSWDEFRDVVEQLTVLDASGNFIRSGAAIGTAENINVASDVLSLLMLQMFGDEAITDPEKYSVSLTKKFRGSGVTTSPGIQALEFYTNFADPSKREYTWNQEQWYSIDAFIDGRTAMMFNYPHHLVTVRSRAPQMHFTVSRMPQTESLLTQKKAIDYASYFGLAVAQTSDRRRVEAAWRFLLFMAEPEQQQEPYIRYTAEAVPLPARRDLIEQLLDDPDFSVFAQQALTARSWYQPDDVAVRMIFSEMIESVVAGMSPGEAVKRANDEISTLLRKIE